METSKTEKMLKMTNVRSKKQKCEKKIKGLLVLGDITPRTKSNLLETFVSNRHYIFFEIKVLKKLSTLANMSGYYCIVCHVNMHCSGTTYSHFCFKHLAKKALKKANYPEITPKTNKKSFPRNFETRKHA